MTPDPRNGSAPRRLLNAILRLFGALNAMRSLPRLSIKSAVFLLTLLFVLFPNPFLLVKQIAHFNEPEQCIQTDFDGVDAALRSIDSLAGEAPDSAAVLAAVEQFVYDHVTYSYDWHSWGCVDYWPPAEQVYKGGVEDCDGRAILAVSLLRAHGFRSAHLVGNANHMWAAVDTFEIMGPRAEATFNNADGVTTIALPGFNALLTSLATAMTVFPGSRVLLLSLVVLLLCLHSAATRMQLLSAVTLLLGGLYLLKDWGGLFRRDIVGALSLELLFGLLLILAAFVLAGRRLRS